MRDFIRWLLFPKAYAQELFEKSLTREALGIERIVPNSEISEVLVAIRKEIDLISPFTLYRDIIIELSCSFNAEIYIYERLQGREAKHILQNNYEIFRCPVRINPNTDDLIDGKWRIVVNQVEAQE